ncbi:MAG: hypothetical protein ACM3IJ_01855 [Candidatus Levyibacteriota bacterium]
MKELALELPGYGGITPPPNIPSGNDAPNVINAFINLFIVVGLVAAVIFVAYGGVLWVMSAGDKAKLDRARRTITFSIIGLVIMLLAFVIVQIIGGVLGVSFLSNLGK